MKFPQLAKVTSVLGLFICATHGMDDNYLTYICDGVGFYSKSVFASAFKSFQHINNPINGYPAIYPAYGLPGRAPYRLFPMNPNGQIYNGEIVAYYFLIVDAYNQSIGMMHSTPEGLKKCDAA